MSAHSCAWRPDCCATQNGGVNLWVLQNLTTSVCGSITCGWRSDSCGKQAAPGVSISGYASFSSRCRSRYGFLCATMTPHFVEVTITVQVVLTRTITTLGAMPILVASQRDCHALPILVCDIDDASQFVVIAVVKEFSFVIVGA